MDYIYIDKSLCAVDSYTLKSPLAFRASDHVPVITRIALDQKRGEQCGILVGLLIVILYLVSLVILPVIITQKKRPEAALAWVMLVIFVPFIGPFCIWCLVSNG